MSMKHRKLGRTSDPRRAMLRAMVTYLLENGQIKTTVTRAKEVAPVAESVPPLAKKNDRPPYRRAWGNTPRGGGAKKLFKGIAPRFAARSGASPRVVKLGPRRGDAAEMAIVQLV